MTATGARISILLVVVSAAWIVLATGCVPAAHSPAPDPQGSASVIERPDTGAGVAMPARPGRRKAAPPADYIRLGEMHRSRGTVRERLLAQRILEEGLRAYPRDADLLVALGKTYYEQSSYGDAERVFSRVLSDNPLRCDAHRYLGANAFRKWKRVQAYTDHLATAIEHLRHAVDCAHGDKESHTKLAFAGYATGDTTLALDACEAFRNRHPDAPEPLFLAGAIAFDRGRWEECRDLFTQALALLSGEDELAYTDIALLLCAREDVRSYEEAGPEEKRNLQVLYWLEHDPDPTTAVNERLLEHVYRTFLAEVRFASSAPRLRGWETERGKALIKFGPPAHFRSTLGGARPWDGRTEVWTYVRADRAFDLFFRDEYLNGNYVVPANDEVSARTLFADPPLTGLTDDSEPLVAVIDVTVFRESDVSGAVYLSFAAAEDHIRRHLWTWHTESFVSRTAFFGTDGSPRACYTRTIPAESLHVHALPGGRARHFVARYELPFDSYRMAHCFEDERGLTRSLAWSSANTTRFIGGSLVLSDILLHTAPAEGSSAFVERSGKRFFPSPGGSFANSEKLRLYMEIYNLTVSRGTSAFDVTYSIHPARAPASGWRDVVGRIKTALSPAGTEPAIAQSFQRTGLSRVASEELLVDIDALEPGEYVLSASVRDAHSGERATRSKAFVKLTRAAD